ncbi:DUF6082 family protein [Kitasatospora albolonga]
MPRGLLGSAGRDESEFSGLRHGSSSVADTRRCPGSSPGPAATRARPCCGPQASSFITEGANEAQLELNLRTFFSGDVGRQYWDRGRSGWAGLLEAAESKKKARFLAIADRAYESAAMSS